MFGKLATVMGLGAMFNNPYFDAKDIKDEYEGVPTPVYFSSSNPIHIPSRSQRVKSKRLKASNKRQGRV